MSNKYDYLIEPFYKQVDSEYYITHIFHKDAFFDKRVILVSKISEPDVYFPYEVDIYGNKAQALDAEHVNQVELFLSVIHIDYLHLPPNLL